MPTQDQAAKLQNAIGLFGANRIDDAVRALETVLAAEPKNSAAVHFLGLCKHRQGQSQAALDLLLKSIELDPQRAPFYSNLGLFFAERNDLSQAAEAYAKAIQLDRTSAQTHSNLGNVLQRKGQIQDAIDCFKAALRIDPNFLHALNNLAGALAGIGSTREAIEAFGQALRISPSTAEIHVNLGNLYLADDQLDAAVERFREALKLRPDYADAFIGLARGLRAKGDSAAAAEQLRQAFQRQPSNAKVYLELGNVLRDNGQIDDALSCFEKAAALDPTNFYAQWNACLALPIIYRTQEEIGLHRERWRAGVKALQEFVQTGNKSGATRFPFTAPHTNFYLHYQGLNDLAEQREFAKIISTLALRAYPDLGQPPAGTRSIPLTPPSAFAKAAADKPGTFSPTEGEGWGEEATFAERKVKVGFVSSFFSLHTVFKLFHGWIKHLNRESFETHVLHLGKDFDKASRYLQEQSDHFFSDFKTPNQIIHRIRTCDLDVLIYPEIGMDPITQSLAALRLAPVQCMAWGHPVTSGLETIDYFLSSELMEGPGADAHYAETLVRLPNLSIYYPTPDISIAQRPEGLGTLEKNKTHFLCLQSLFKLLPQFDDLFPRIALQAPNSEFWFIALDSKEVTELFRRRLADSFSKRGLDPAKHVRVFPKMKIGAFFGLVKEADIILDSVGWSGGNTTFEAIAFDKPVVTLPGEMMRSRHSYAILTLMGVSETVAEDVDDYVGIAARLALDEPWRSGISAQIRANRSRVYGDLQAVRGLERFLVNVVAAGGREA